MNEQFVSEVKSLIPYQYDFEYELNYIGNITEGEVPLADIIRMTLEDKIEKSVIEDLIVKYRVA
jgi:hypothetical protein